MTSRANFAYELTSLLEILKRADGPCDELQPETIVDYLPSLF